MPDILLDSDSTNWPVLDSDHQDTQAPSFNARRDAVIALSYTQPALVDSDGGNAVQHRDTFIDKYIVCVNCDWYRASDDACRKKLQYADADPRAMKLQCADLDVNCPIGNWSDGEWFEQH